jgi:anti-sigma regulatory factor (Ser/Thr protein kinase)
MRIAGSGYRKPMRPDPRFSSVTGIERGRRFEPKPRNVRAAREFVADTLRDEGFAGDPDVVLLLTSELVTNAVRHAATPFEIRVDVEPDKVRVAVIDEDVEHPPEVRHPGPDETNGRGLLLVDQLAAVWGSNRDGRNKSVWFTFA